MSETRLADVILEAVCQGLEPDEERFVRETFTVERVHEMIKEAVGVDDAEEFGSDFTLHSAGPPLDALGELIVNVVHRIREEIARLGR